MKRLTLTLDFDPDLTDGDILAKHLIDRAKASGVLNGDYCIDNVKDDEALCNACGQPLPADQLVSAQDGHAAEREAWGGPTLPQDGGMPVVGQGPGHVLLATPDDPLALRGATPPVYVLGHRFLPMTHLDRIGFAGASPDSLIHHCDHGTVLIYSPSDDTVEEITVVENTDGGEVHSFLWARQQIV